MIVNTDTPWSYSEYLFTTRPGIGWIEPGLGYITGDVLILFLSSWSCSLCLLSELQDISRLIEVVILTRVYLRKLFQFVSRYISLSMKEIIGHSNFIVQNVLFLVYSYSIGHIASIGCSCCF